MLIIVRILTSVALFATGIRAFILWHEGIDGWVSWGVSTLLLIFSTLRVTEEGDGRSVAVSS